MSVAEKGLAHHIQTSWPVSATCTVEGRVSMLCYFELLSTRRRRECAPKSRNNVVWTCGGLAR